MLRTVATALVATTLALFASHALGERIELARGIGKGIEVRYAGVSTLVFLENGKPVFMTDGFFSRPSLNQVLARKIEPDRELVKRILRKELKVTTLEAVIPLHAHYDHAMDASEVAWLASAKLVGDDSIRNVAHADNLDRIEFDEVAAGQSRAYADDWTVTFIAAGHAPTLFGFPGPVKEDFTLPAHVSKWRLGQPWTLLVEHSTAERSFLVHASAGYLDGAIASALRGRKVDVVFLGIGGAGKLSKEERDRLWCETVRVSGAARVIPIHWDNFFRSLDEPLRPMSFVSDDLDETIEHYEDLASKEHRDLRWPLVFEPFDPFRDLPANPPPPIKECK